jgi:hypothetical protein
MYLTRSEREHTGQSTLSPLGRTRPPGCYLLRDAEAGYGLAHVRTPPMGTLTKLYRGGKEQGVTSAAVRTACVRLLQCPLARHNLYGQCRRRVQDVRQGIPKKTDAHQTLDPGRGGVAEGLSLRISGHIN